MPKHPTLWAIRHAAITAGGQRVREPPASAALLRAFVPRLTLPDWDLHAPVWREYLDLWR